MVPLAPLTVMAIQQVVAFGIYGCPGWWYVYPWLRRQPAATAVPIAMVPFLFRFIGAANVVPGVVGPGYPVDSAMLVLVGDVGCALLALAAVAAYRFELRVAPALAWTVVVESVGYSAVYVALADLPAIIENLHAHWYVGAVYVPLLTLNNVLVAALLLGFRRHPG